MPRAALLGRRPMVGRVPDQCSDPVHFAQRSFGAFALLVIVALRPLASLLNANALFEMIPAVLLQDKRVLQQSRDRKWPALTWPFSWSARLLQRRLQSVHLPARPEASCMPIVSSLELQ